MKLRWITAAILALLTLAGAYLSYSQRNDLYDARAKLEAVQERADAQARLNAVVLKYAEQQRAAGDTAEAHAAEAAIRAQRAEAKLSIARRVRDSLSYALDAKDAYKSAYTDEKRAAVAFRHRGDSLAAVSDRLAGIVRDYGNASADILDATHDSFFERLVPEVRPGIAVGIDPFTRRPATAVGVTLSWDF